MTESAKRTFVSGIVPIHTLLLPEEKKVPGAASQCDAHVSAIVKTHIESPSLSEPTESIPKKVRKKEEYTSTTEEIVAQIGERKIEPSSLARPGGSHPKDLEKKLQPDSPLKADDKNKTSSLTQTADLSTTEGEKKDQPDLSSEAEDKSSQMIRPPSLADEDLDFEGLWERFLACGSEQPLDQGLFSEPIPFTLPEENPVIPLGSDEALPPNPPFPLSDDPLAEDLLLFDQKEADEGSNFGLF